MGCRPGTLSEGPEGTESEREDGVECVTTVQLVGEPCGKSSLESVPVTEESLF